MDRTEQAKYYELARREKELHRHLYPTWSARDNYALHSRRKRKRLQDDDRTTTDTDDDRGNDNDEDDDYDGAGDDDDDNIHN